MAEVAHYPLYLGAGLRIHAVQSGQEREADVVSQYVCCHGARWPVARSELDLCSLGHLSRSSANRLPSFRSRHSRNGDRPGHETALVCAV